jgi:signal transduction histidine kinase
MNTWKFCRWLIVATLGEGLLLSLLHRFVYPLPDTSLAVSVLFWIVGALFVFGLSYVYCTSRLRDEDRQSIARLPLRLFLLRPLLWCAVAMSEALWFASEGAMPEDALYRIPGLSLSGSILLGAGLGLLLRREASRALQKDAIWHYAKTLHESLFFVSLVAASVAVLATRLTYHALLGITVVHLRRHLLIMPWVGILAGFIWLWALSYWTRHPRKFLERIASLSLEESITPLALGGRHGLPRFMTPAPMIVPEMVPLAPEASSVYRELQKLPSRLAFYSFGLWFASNAGTTLFQWYWFGSAFEDVLLMLILGSILAFCLSFYILVWHRFDASFGLRYLSLRFPITNEHKQPALRARIAVTFGGLLIFACLAALLSALSQFQRASIALLSQQSKARATDLARELRVSREREYARVLQQELRSPGEVALYMPTEGEPIVAGDLPREARIRELLVSREGSLTLNAESLVGGYVQIEEAGYAIFLIPREQVPGIERSLLILIIFFFVLTSACLGVVFALAKDLTSPLEELIQHTSRIAKGDMSRIPLAGSGEIGTLIFSFERMRSSLAETLIRIDELNTGLEDKVKARTAEVERKRQELEETLQQLKEAQGQLVQSEKMASLGFLVAGIAHDINNPINAIRNNLGPLEELSKELLSVVSLYQAAAKSFEEERDDAEELLAKAEAKVKALNYEEAQEDLARILRILQNGAERTAKIVASLKNFSRAGESRQRAVDLHYCLDETLELIGYHLRQKQITVKKDYGSLGVVSCDAGAINQVFMNLLSNAIDALKEQPNPTISIHTKQEGSWVVLDIQDNGPGIPKEILERIFEPFFTTKEGHGTGLGLSISRKIIVSHGGSIEVSSSPGDTRFSIRLPSENPERQSTMA